MSQHTPGPWAVGDVRFDKQRADIDAPKGDSRLEYTNWTSLARVYGSEYNPLIGGDVMMANARLIAAAPDLYNALVAVLDALNCDVENAPISSVNARAAQAWIAGKVRMTVLAALNKAEGRS